MKELSILVRAAQRGDLEAFGQIIERFQAMAYASAYAIVDDAQLAEDVAQEAFIEAYLNLPRLREPAAFPGWFRRIVFKQGDRMTRGKHFITTSLETACDVPLTIPDPEQVVEAEEVKESIRCAIETLPEHERMTIILFYSTGYALKEIAVFLEVPVTTVKKRLYDGRRHLKDVLLEMSSLHEWRQASMEHFSHKVQLLIAARTGDLVSVKKLLDQEPSLINLKTERQEVLASRAFQLMSGHSTLHEAASHGHVAVVQLLIDYGANINNSTRIGITPLHNAVLYKHGSVVELLLARGADANAACSNGHTPLHWAAIRGYTEIAALLLNNGARTNVVSRYGKTALDWALLKGRTEIVALLRGKS